MAIDWGSQRGSILWCQWQVNDLGATGFAMRTCKVVQGLQ